MIGDKYMDKCMYCNGTEGVTGSHIKLCPFNPVINIKIIEYLERLVSEDEVLNVSAYNIYAKKNKLPRSSTIYSLFKRNYGVTFRTTTDAFIFLIYKSYELNLITDLELLDLLVYKITWGSMGLGAKESIKIHDQISLKAGTEDARIYCFMNFAKLVLDIDPDV